ncbi:MAG: DUF4979 domain-containing protein [Prevotellaceae bacterium]|nr:DUF4979 domain-containing protein [Prevotellaceae bacterium]
MTATSCAPIADDTNTPDAISITYDGLTRYTTFNAKDGSVSNTSEVVTYSAEEMPTYTAEADGNMTILVDYILVDNSDAQSISISYEATQSGETVGERSVSDVPIQRNYLTTVSGKALNSTESSTENEKGSGTDSEDFDGNLDVDMDEIAPYNDIVVTAGSSWTLGQEDASYEVLEDENGEYYVYVTTNESGRGDLKLASSDNHVVIDLKEAPILCFRLTVVSDDAENYSQTHITIDTSGNLLVDGDDDNNPSGTKYSGGLSNGDTKWNTKYYCKDGTDLLIYELTGDNARTLQNGSTSSWETLPSACSFGTFQIKYADIKDSNSNATQAYYKFYWFKSFATMDDLETYLKEINLEYSSTAYN